MKNHLVFWGVAAAVAILLPPAVFAASMNTGQTVSVNGASPAEGNVYAVGGTVNTAGPISGDLIMAGGTIFSTAKVNGDIMVAGGNLNLTGVTAQDIRMAGGNIMLSGTLSGELVMAGGQVVIAPDAKIAKDSYIAGGSISFSGNEAGNLKMAGGDLYIDGTVKGNLTISRANKVTIGPHAVIGGTLEYGAPVPATIESGARITGEPIFHVVQPRQNNRQAAPGVFGFLTVIWFLKFLAGLAAAYLLWYLFRGDSLAVLEEIKARYGRSLLHGFALLILMPIAAIIALITVIGSIPGLLALLAYVTLLVLTVPATILLVAALLLRGKTDLKWYHILIAALIIAIVRFIPFIGWIAYALVYLGALGAVGNILKGKFVAR